VLLLSFFSDGAVAPSHFFLPSMSICIFQGIQFPLACLPFPITGFYPPRPKSLFSPLHNLPLPHLGSHIP
jgi:hypothetical protein